MGCVYPYEALRASTSADRVPIEHKANAMRCPIQSGESLDSKAAVASAGLLDLEGAATALGFVDFASFRAAVAAATPPEAEWFASMFASYVGGMQ